jgi:hypothetical protein
MKNCIPKPSHENWKKSQCHKNEEKFHSGNFVKTQQETLRSLILVGSTYLPAEPAGSTNSVDVELTVVGQVVVDDQRHLLHVNAARPHVSGYQHTALTRPLMIQKHLQTGSIKVFILIPF